LPFASRQRLTAKAGLPLTRQNTAEAITTDRDKATRDGMRDSLAVGALRRTCLPRRNARTGLHGTLHRHRDKSAFGIRWGDRPSPKEPYRAALLELQGIHHLDDGPRRRWQAVRSLLRDRQLEDRGRRGEGRLRGTAWGNIRLQRRRPRRGKSGGADLPAPVALSVNWLRVSCTSEFVCKARRCWVSPAGAEAARFRSFGRSKCREPSNGNGYRRV
jgi:hypothetical protein